MESTRFAEYFPAILVAFAASIVAGVLLTFAAFFAGGLFAYALADSLAGIWFAAAVLAGAVALYVIFRWLDDRERQAEHEREISRMQAEAVLREQQPQPRPETLAVTTGVQIERVGNLIDRRDLIWFCENIASSHDWSARRWESITLPFGFHISNKNPAPDGTTSYSRLLALFTECQPPIIVDRSERHTGTLTCRDPEQMVKRIVGSTPH